VSKPVCVYVQYAWRVRWLVGLLPMGWVWGSSPCYPAGWIPLTLLSAVDCLPSAICLPARPAVCRTDYTTYALVQGAKDRSFVQIYSRIPNPGPVFIAEKKAVLAGLGYPAGDIVDTPQVLVCCCECDGCGDCCSTVLLFWPDLPAGMPARPPAHPSRPPAEPCRTAQR
jgi:hypothetical protein